MGKKKVAVLFGGQSTEHEVSCMSAYSVLKNIDTDLYDVSAIGITKTGNWTVCDDIETVRSDSWKETAEKKCGMTEVLPLLYACDVIFPVLHGICGEDGTVQGLFELIGKPYVGCGVLASAVCMDKVYTKIVLKDAGIPQCRHLVAERDVILKRDGTYERMVSESFGFPCFVKPSNSGSSVGAFKVAEENALLPALLEAQQYDRKILIEEYVNAREIECAVLGNGSAAAVSTPGEIIPSKEFYDYEDKYISGTSITQIPARVPEDVLENIRTLAKKAYNALDCAGLSRVDFFYDRDTGRVLLNEINTLPGFTDISMYAKMWAHDGMDFRTLVTRLIELAFENAARNQRNGVK